MGVLTLGASAKLGLYSGGLSERPMEPVLKTGGQKCLVGSNPTPSARNRYRQTPFLRGCGDTPSVVKQLRPSIEPPRWAVHRRVLVGRCPLATSPSPGPPPFVRATEAITPTSGSTVEMIGSNVTRRAISHRSLMPTEPRLAPYPARQPPTRPVPNSAPSRSNAMRRCTRATSHRCRSRDRRSTTSLLVSTGGCGARTEAGSYAICDYIESEAPQDRPIRRTMPTITI